MEFLILLISILVIWIYIKTRPLKPIYRSDIEPKDGDIPITESKKMLRQYLKDFPDQIPDYSKDLSKSEINEYISFVIEDFTETFKGDVDDLKFELKDQQDEYKELMANGHEEDALHTKQYIDEIKEQLGNKDSSDWLLWKINQLRGVDGKTNSELRKRNYKKN